MPLTNEQVLFSLHRHFGAEGGVDPAALPATPSHKKGDAELSEFTKELIKDFDNLTRLKPYLDTIIAADKDRKDKAKPTTPTTATPTKPRPKRKARTTSTSRKSSTGSTVPLGVSEAKLFDERFDKTLREKERVNTILSNHYGYKPGRADPSEIDYKKSEELLRHAYLLYMTAIIKAQTDLANLETLPTLPVDDGTPATQLKIAAAQQEIDRINNITLAIAMDIWRADKLLRVYIRWFRDVYIKSPIDDDSKDDASIASAALDAAYLENKKVLLDSIGYKIQNPPSEEWKSPAIAGLATGVAVLFGISTHESFFPREQTPIEGGADEALPGYDDEPPAYEEAPLPIDDVGANDEDQLNALYWAAIAASSVTNAANYAASLVQVLTYLHNIQEVAHFWRDGELFNSTHKPIPITAEQKIQYCLQIFFYGVGWTTVLASAFFAAFGPMGLFMLPFILLSMVLASKFVIDAHLYNLSEKSWDIFCQTITGLSFTNNTAKNWFSNLGLMLFGFIPAAAIAPMMGYAFFGKFLSAFNSFIPELGIDLIALGTGAATMGPLLLTILPLVLAIYVFHSKLPNWIRYPLTILLVLTGCVGIGLAISTIGWPILLIALGAIMGTFVSIVVFKMLINAAIRFVEIGKKFKDEVFMPVYKDNKFAAFALCLLFLTPLAALILLNALANAVLSTFGLEGFLPTLNAFTAGEVNGVFLLATMAGFSLILGTRSTLDLLIRYFPSLYKDIKKSDFIAEISTHSALVQYTFCLTVLPVLVSVMIPFVALYGLAKAAIYLAPVLMHVARDLFVLSGLLSKAPVAAGTATPSSGSSSSSASVASGGVPGKPEFTPPQEIHGGMARTIAVFGGLLAGILGVGIYAACIPAYLIVKGLSAAFNSAFGESKAPVVVAGAAPAVPASKSKEAPKPGMIFDSVLTSTFKALAPAPVAPLAAAVPT